MKDYLGSPLSDEDGLCFTNGASDETSDYVYCTNSFGTKSPSSVTSSFAILSPESYQGTSVAKNLSSQGENFDSSYDFGIESISASPDSTQPSEDDLTYGPGQLGIDADFMAQNLATDVSYSGFAGAALSDGVQSAPDHEDFRGRNYGVVDSCGNRVPGLTFIPGAQGYQHHPNDQLGYQYVPFVAERPVGLVPAAQLVWMPQSSNVTNQGPWNSHNQLRSPGVHAPSMVLFDMSGDVQHTALWNGYYGPNTSTGGADLTDGGQARYRTAAGNQYSYRTPTQASPYVSHNLDLGFSQRATTTRHSPGPGGFQLINDGLSGTPSREAASRGDGFVKTESQSPTFTTQEELQSEQDHAGSRNFTFVNDHPVARPNKPTSPENFSFAESLSKKNYPEKTASALASHKAGKSVMQKHTGRPVGSHLAPETARHASDMRKHDACWRCRIQRDKCSMGEVCERCAKAKYSKQSPDSGLGCCRAKIVEFTTVFVPGLMTKIHDGNALKRMADEHIEFWHDQQYELALTCGQGMPYMPVNVYEFCVRTPELLRQHQYVKDANTGDVHRYEKRSPPVGIMLENQKEGINRCKRYVESIVANDDLLQPFARVCYEEEQNYVLSEIFQLLFKFRPQTEEERKVQQEAYQLIVVTYIMTHTLTIPDGIIDDRLCGLESYQAGQYPPDCSSRFTNKQLKHFFAQLHRMCMGSLLNWLQQILKSSKWTERWATAFIAVVALALALEEIQLTAHLTMDSLVKLGKADPVDGERQAVEACKEIDSDFRIVREIFKTKYTRTYNPLRDPESTWASKISCQETVRFVNDAKELFSQNGSFIYSRSEVEIGSTNRARYAGRLVSKFLLMFYAPSKGHQ